MTIKPSEKDRNGYSEVGKQLKFSFMPEAPGIVWRLASGRWHAELCGGWWVCVAASKKAAIAGVKKAYKAERARY